MIASPTSRTCATNSSVESSTRKPGIDSSLSSVPPVCPRPRPLIFPNGTPQAATIGPTASEVLSPTPPVECLSTTLRPSAPCRSSVSPLSTIASVSASVSSARQPAEEHGHAERRHLVVGDLAARVAEDELADLVGRQAPAVALALDQLRGRGSLATSRRSARRGSRGAAPCRRARRSPSRRRRRTPPRGSARRRSCPRRRRAAARARASGRSTASSGRSRGRT